MPHPGTHITALQMLAAETPGGGVSLAEALGGTRAEPMASEGVDAAMALRHRYACLGAVGPDLLYFMVETSTGAQTAQDLICKYFATLRVFERLSDTVSEIWEQALATGDKAYFCGILQLLDDVGGEFTSTIGLAMGVLKSGLEAMAADGLGLNLFSIIKSPRQENKKPVEWFWADHLHYVRTGEFTKNLLDLAYLHAPYKAHPELQAYALGYLTHVIGDVIGHPYVNQIVGGPYRLHRQRHTLIENFIDGYVWSFCHTPTKGPGTISGDKNPMTGRRWLDAVQPSAASCGSDWDAAWYRCRINEFLDVGSEGGFLPGIESALDAMADAFQSGSNLAFGTQGVKVRDDQLFATFCDMFIAAMRKTYGGKGRQHHTR